MKSCVSSGPTAWRGTGSVSMTSPVGSHDAERDDEVLDLSVARGEDTRTARGDVAAHRCELGRRGIVREHEPALVQLGLQPLAVHARLGGHGERVLVHIDDAVETLQVESDSAMSEDGSALASRTASPGDDGDAVLVREQEDRRDVFVRGRENDEIRAAEGRSARTCGDRLPVRVGFVRVEAIARL